MPTYCLILFLYLLTVNFVSMAVTWADKRKAQQNKWRTRESTLICLGMLGGAPAMWLTMLGIRHKTTRKKFMVGLPVIFLTQFSLAGIVFLLIEITCSKFYAPVRENRHKKASLLWECAQRGFFCLKALLSPFLLKKFNQ